MSLCPLLNPALYDGCIVCRYRMQAFPEGRNTLSPAVVRNSTANEIRTGKYRND